MARRRCTGLPGAFGLDGLLVNISADNRMITGGEDALYIARRLIVCSSEDIGMADPHALPLVSSHNKEINTSARFSLMPKAMATYQACQTVGLPECRINLAVSCLRLSYTIS